jgi:SnoaL-like domain
MMRWLGRVAMVGAAVALAIWGWRAFFPSPEQIVRKRLIGLAQVASFAPNEASLMKVARAQKLASFFTSDAEITVDLPGHFPQSINGREEVLQVAMSARTMLKAIKVQFLDIGVKLDDDREAGVAHFTVKADVAGENTPQVEELEAQFKKLGGDWLIKRVQNVRTLR